MGRLYCKYCEKYTDTIYVEIHDTNISAYCFTCNNFIKNLNSDERKIYSDEVDEAYSRLPKPKSYDYEDLEKLTDMLKDNLNIFYSNEVLIIHFNNQLILEVNLHDN